MSHISDGQKKRGFQYGGQNTRTRHCTECGERFHPGGWENAAAAVTCTAVCSRRRKSRLQKERRAAVKQNAAAKNPGSWL